MRGFFMLAEEASALNGINIRIGGIQGFTFDLGEPLRFVGSILIGVRPEPGEFGKITVTMDLVDADGKLVESMGDFVLEANEDFEWTWAAFKFNESTARFPAAGNYTLLLRFGNDVLFSLGVSANVR